MNSFIICNFAIDLQIPINMLINFSIQNFGSIKEKQTLSFEADKSTHLEDYYVIQTNGLRLLKLALIYGANASGKTTILKALQFLIDIVLKPQDQKTQSLDFDPFLFDPNTPKQNTIFNIDFIQNNKRYLYEVELKREFVVKEVLSYTHTPNKLKKCIKVFERTTNSEHQFADIVFGANIKIDEVYTKTLISNTLWNNTVLGGFLKTNINLKELIDATNWFKKYPNPIIYKHTELESFVTENINNENIDITTVSDVLKKADFSLSDIFFKQKEEDIPHGLIELMQINNMEDNIKKLKEKGKITISSLEFKHAVKNKSYPLPFEKESQGTQRYYGLAGVLYVLIKNSTAILIDELETSLHPDLFQHFLLSFLVNSKSSQIIATTHNREILNNKDIFRNDTIWITDKNNEESATELYSLADFDTKVIRDTTNILNAYKSGKLGGTPNLGDYYIEIEDNEVD